MCFINHLFSLNLLNCLILGLIFFYFCICTLDLLTYMSFMFSHEFLFLFLICRVNESTVRDSLADVVSGFILEKLR